jgi:hypothetical protein
MNLRVKKPIDYKSIKIVGTKLGIKSQPNSYKKKIRMPNGYSHFRNDLQFAIINGVNSRGHGLKRVK